MTPQLHHSILQTSVKAGFGLGSNRNLKSRFLAQVQP